MTKENKHKQIAYKFYKAEKAKKIVKKHIEIRRIIGGHIKKTPGADYLHNKLRIFQATLLIYTSSVNENLNIRENIYTFFNHVDSDTFIHNWIKVNFSNPTQKESDKEKLKKLAIKVILKGKGVRKNKTVDNIFRNINIIEKADSFSLLSEKEKKLIKSLLKIGATYKPATNLVAFDNTIKIIQTSVNPVRAATDWFKYKTYKNDDRKN